MIKQDEPEQQPQERGDQEHKKQKRNPQADQTLKENLKRAFPLYYTC